MSNLNLAMIGNCSFSGLINQTGSLVWCCLPHFDGDPVFNALINGKKGLPAHQQDDAAETGFWDIRIADFDRSEQAYIPNTAIVRTVLYDKQGSAVEIVDFAPRYEHYGRYFRPSLVTRIVTPLKGEPRITMRLRPSFDYGATKPRVDGSSNHIRFSAPGQVLRLNTDAPIAYISKEVPFILDRTYTFLFGQDESVKDALHKVGSTFREQTEHYWKEYARNLALPFEWQEEMIRAAITLKMCTFEETGAVLAATTTSIPEAADTVRNWDYRYCWLRDSLFVIHALNRLGVNKTMEDYIRYIMNVATARDDGDLQPLYSITLAARLEEYEAEHLAGYRGMGPVRIGNQAYEQVQHDVYGAVILALTQAFFDKRLTRPATIDDFHRLEHFGEKAVECYDKPDAGIWELREIARTHTFSAAMCWAAADRLAKIATHLGLEDRGHYWRNHADAMHAKIVKEAWDAEQNSFVASFEGDELDSSLLLLHELDFVDAKDPRFLGTIAAIEKGLKKDKLLYRYVIPDDFGEPETAFTICTFWYIDALAAAGRTQEARELFEYMLECRNHVGLLSEDLDFKTQELWGNFPQTYSMVGLINSAMRLSKTWEEAL